MYESGRYITKSENRTVTSSTTDGNSFEGVPLNWADVPLVGREKEERTIRNVLCKNRQKQAKSEAIFIHGSSGTGKSSLVRAVLLSEQERGQEFWVSGKYAQSDGLSRPFSAVIDAATELCHTVRDSSESVSIRNNIRSNLTDDELQILCAVVPMIGFLLPNSTDQINPTYGVVNESTLIRFMSLFRAFLAAICSPSHPIVLFLDDLQWADDASRKLLSSFFMDLDLENFLFIGIVRDGEETTFDPPADTLIPCHQLVCGSLIESNVNKIVAVATGLKEEETKQLGWIVFRRTYGNPFFVKQFLESLHREELISYNAKDERFDWDVDIIAKRMSPSSNVVDLLVDEISSLPRDSQLVLVIASTLGYTFDASVLETILESVDLMSLFPRKLLLDEENAAADPVEAPLLQSHDAFCNVNLQKSLRKASKAGLIQQIYPGKYKFTHDRVQQSATRLLPGGRRGERIKSNLGLLVLELSRSNKSEDWMLFTATNLLLENSIDIDNDKVAKLCLEAAKKASLQAAFKSSATYADSGLKKLGSSGWKSNYELCLDLCSLSAEMHYSNGNLKSTKKRVKIIEKKASKAEDRFRAYNVLIDMLFSEDDFSGCIEEGQRGMEYLGVKTPKNPGLLNVASNLLKCKRLLAGRKASDLSSLPTMDNATVEEVLRLMSTTAMASWHNGDNNHCVVLCLIMFQTTLKHGISVHAPYALVAYAVCLSHLGEMKEAVEYGTAALQLLKLPGMEPAVAKTLVVVHSFLWHLKFPMRESSAELTKAYEVGVKAADSLQSCMALRVAGALGIFVGAKSLPEHERYVGNDSK
jgi:predicted ATPase